MTKKYKGIEYANTRMYITDFGISDYDPKKGWVRYRCSLVDHGAWPEEGMDTEEEFKVIACGDSEWIGELRGNIMRLMRHAYRRGYNAALEAVREESKSKAS